MQVDRFAVIVLMAVTASPITFPTAAFGSSAAAAFQVAQAGPRSTPQPQAQPAPAAAESNQEVEGQITDLRHQLNIKPAQQPQFDALAQAMRQNADAMKKLLQQQSEKSNAVDAVRVGQQFAQAEAEGLGRLLPPLEALYGTLSDQQKRTADRLFGSGPEQEEEGKPPKRR